MKFRNDHPTEQACGNCKSFSLMGDDNWGEFGDCKDPECKIKTRYANYNDCSRFEWHAYPQVALSIRQPFSHHILHGDKDVENRDWRTHFRGLLLIHAGLKVEDKEFCEKHKCPTGAIVGMVEVVDCVTEMDSPWFYGKYGFVLQNPIVLEPIPCKGKQGFFKPDIDFASLCPL